MSNECFDEAPLSPFFLESKRLREFGRQNRIPVTMTWELTPYCNLNCPMCYVHLTPAQAASKGKHLTAAQWLELGRQFAEMGLMYVNITGGEPLLHPEFWEIYEGVCRLGIYPTIFTNGCLIDERAIEHLKQYPPRTIKLSLYGASDETYERMCGVKNGFTKVKRAIELLIDAGIYPFLTTTVIKQNRDDLEAMTRFAFEHNLLLAATDEIVQSARGADTDAEAVRVSIREQKTDLASLEAKRLQKEYGPELFSTCHSYGGSGVVTWHGHLQVCDFFDLNLL